MLLNFINSFKISNKVFFRKFNLEMKSELISINLKIIFSFKVSYIHI